MENASKALIMVAGVLIGVLVLSLAVYLFTSFGSTSSKLHKEREETEISEFNAQFTSYEGKTNTIYDVVSIAKLATENNIKYEIPFQSGRLDQYGAQSNYYVAVKLNNKNIETGYNDKIVDYENEYIKPQLSDKKTYTCTTTISSVTSRISEVCFNQIK